MAKRRSHPSLTIERLEELLTYDPETGIFVFRVERGQKPVGTVAGYFYPNGRCQIAIDGEDYFRARLAWFWMTGEHPRREVDHKDGDPGNDRWVNLRLATTSQNHANRRGYSASGFKGVYRDKKTWAANITINGKVRHLGNFKTPELAHAAYIKAATEHYGEFARLDHSASHDRA